MWNDSINTQSNEKSLENLDMFDDLDLLEEDCVQVETTINSSIVTPHETCADVGYFIKNINFDKVVQEKQVVVYSDVPLKQTIKVFCEQYDYRDLKDFLKDETLTNEDAILNWLQRIYNIIIDCEYDEALLQFSEQDLDSICCLYRNMYLSELIMIASHLKKDYFDKTVIRDYSLEMRDTGLLLELMQNNCFNQEEAVLYTNNLDTFNAYLLLKTSGKFEAAVFESVKDSDENLNSYAKTVLSNNPWAFLGSHKNFGEIIQLVQSTEIPIELAERYKDNAYLYQILLAYSRGLYSSAFINNYLVIDNLYSAVMAELYANCELDAQTLAGTDGNFYLAKFVFDVKAHKMDSKCAINSAESNLDILYNFAKVLLDAVFEQKLSENEWRKFVCYIAYKKEFIVCEEYLRYKEIHGVMTFNQFWYFKLTSSLNISARIPENVGELVMYQNGTAISYFNVQMVWEAFDILLESIKDKLDTNLVVKLLPEQRGIIICQKDYNKFSDERTKFQKFTNCKSSLTYSVESNNTEEILRYNSVKMIQLAKDIHAGSISDSFKCLTMISPEKYLVYDNLLSLICTSYQEFAGLCMSSEAIQCLKLFNNMLKLPTRIEVQVGFLKAYLEFKFKYRIRFESFNTTLMQEIKFIEVKNSYSYSDCSFAKVISTLDNFTNELNKKSTIICKYDGVSKMIFEGA